MSWPKVATALIFVAGAVVAAALGKEPLSMVLAGAAAGFITSGSISTTTPRLNTDK